ncbi:hypothetical protein I4F81_012926 [Pyropia yezoensis]|uniref:TATA-box-binding protein n=1 Tax=Pyropia yezoensis TaxID=2788 RepID=A0ABQ9T852_PYRYE|nr:hypothetical protein I4F81_012926 [Neopyropia yezoensis]
MSAMAGPAWALAGGALFSGGTPAADAVGAPAAAARARPAAAAGRRPRVAPTPAAAAGPRFHGIVPQIQNVVATTNLGRGLSHGHHMFCSYEPELFPGLIYRMINPKIVLLIFVSGKVVLTGAKLRQEIYDAFNNIYHVLLQFRKPRPNAAPASSSGTTAA